MLIYYLYLSLYSLRKIFIGQKRIVVVFDQDHIEVTKIKHIFYYPTKEGFEFLHWELENETQVLDIWKLSSGTKLFARWKSNV